MKPKAIMKLRLSLGLTVQKFADQVGVSYVTMSRWENGHCKPQPGHLNRLREIAAGGITTKAGKGSMKDDQFLAELARLVVRYEKEHDETPIGMMVDLGNKPMWWDGERFR